MRLDLGYCRGYEDELAQMRTSRSRMGSRTTGGSSKLSSTPAEVEGQKILAELRNMANQKVFKS